MLHGNISYNASTFKLKLDTIGNLVPELHWPLFKLCEALESSMWLMATILDSADRAKWSVRRSVWFFFCCCCYFEFFKLNSIASDLKWKWKSLSRVWLFATPIVHGIFQARILEWVAFPFSRGPSQPRDRTQVSHIAGGFFTSWATKETQEYWSG